MCQAAVYDEAHANGETFTAAVQKYCSKNTKTGKPHQYFIWIYINKRTRH